MVNKYLYFSLAAGMLFTFGGGCVNSDLSATKDLEVDLTFEDSLADTDMADTQQTWSYQGKLAADKIENKTVRITTAKGDIVFELLPDVAPLSVSNFVYLAEGGYYDGLNFHRREEGFVIQGGDPLGNGMGGPGYSIPAEFNALKHERGMVAMARSMDPDSAGSQFYITLAPAYFLDGNYTVFGRVLEGMEVVDELRKGDIMTKVVVENK